ncbi:hypothetical protein [Nocardia gipuzkoensis]
MRMDRSPGTLPKQSAGRLTYLPVMNGVFGTAPRDTRRETIEDVTGVSDAAPEGAVTGGRSVLAATAGPFIEIPR